MTRRLTILLVAVIGLLVALASPAAAHNSLVSSEPADGAVMAPGAGEIVFNFAKAVPLDTFSAEVVDATGARRALSGARHGASDLAVVVPVDGASSGALTYRWRLVGADGHVVSGRVSISVAPAAVEVAVTTVPIPVVETPTPTLPPPVVKRVDVSSGAWSLPSPVRWLLRMLSYVAILLIGGVVASALFVWPKAMSSATLRRPLRGAVGAVGLLSLVHLLVVASDIRGVAPWNAFGGLGGALQTIAGRGFATRLVLAGLLGAVLFGRTIHDDRVRLATGAGLTMLLLATWAWSGHARSLRWPIVGVPLDVAHHAAAAAWLGGIGIVALVAFREKEAEELLRCVQRFARLAPVCVAVLVGTGVLQVLRLDGNPFGLLGTTHGRLLVVKLLAIGVMLKIADINRRRVQRRFRTTGTMRTGATEMLRRAMGTELAVGLMAIGVTAGLVVSPPASANVRAIGAVAPTARTTTATTMTTAPTTTIALPATSVASAASGIPAAATTVRQAPCTIAAAVTSGATGPDVVCLQQALITAGLLTGQASGTFDDATDRAVRSFQTAHQLAADGVAGRLTATALGIWVAP